MAIAARSELPLEEAREGLPGEAEAGEARWVEASAGGLRVASVYVPNGRAVGLARVPEEARVLRRDARARGRPRRARRRPQRHARGRRRLRPRGLRRLHARHRRGARPLRGAARGRPLDAYRDLHPDDVGFTWWDYRQGHFHRKMGLRIDYLLLGQRSRAASPPAASTATTARAPSPPTTRPCSQKSRFRSTWRLIRHSHPRNAPGHADRAWQLLRLRRSNSTLARTCWSPRRRRGSRACCTSTNCARAGSTTRRSRCASATAGSTPFTAGCMRSGTRTSHVRGGGWRPSRRAMTAGGLGLWSVAMHLGIIEWEDRYPDVLVLGDRAPRHPRINGHRTSYLPPEHVDHGARDPGHDRRTDAAGPRRRCCPSTGSAAPCARRSSSSSPPYGSLVAALHGPGPGARPQEARPDPRHRRRADAERARGRRARSAAARRLRPSTRQCAVVHRRPPDRPGLPLAGAATGHRGRRPPPRRSASSAAADGERQRLLEASGVPRAPGHLGAGDRPAKPRPCVASPTPEHRDETIVQAEPDQSSRSTGGTVSFQSRMTRRSRSWPSSQTAAVPSARWPA